MKADQLLPDMLDVAVPLWIMGMRTSTFEQRQARARRCADLLAEPEMGEAVLFNIKGKSGPAFNAVAETIAILAFQPGGVKVFGRRYEATEKADACECGCHDVTQPGLIPCPECEHSPPTPRVRKWGLDPMMGGRGRRVSEHRRPPNNNGL